MPTQRVSSVSDTGSKHHRDKHGVVHRVVGEQDWTWEHFLACDYNSGYRIEEAKIVWTGAPVTCITCVAFVVPAVVREM